MKKNTLVRDTRSSGTITGYHRVLSKKLIESMTMQQELKKFTSKQLLPEAIEETRGVSDWTSAWMSRRNCPKRFEMQDLSWLVIDDNNDSWVPVNCSKTRKLYKHASLWCFPNCSGGENSDIAINSDSILPQDWNTRLKIKNIFSKWPENVFVFKDPCKERMCFSRALESHFWMFVGVLLHVS